MNPLPIILLSVTLSTLSAGVLFVIIDPTEVEGQVVIDEPASPDLENVYQRLTAQEELIRNLSAKLELRTPQSSGSARNADLESVVHSVLEKERARAAAKSATTSPEHFNVTRAHDQFLRLQRAGASDSEINSFWDEVRARGSVSEVLTAFEEYALSNPSDIDAQIELGNAYLERLEEATTGPEMGKWAIKADGAFDSALALDETNWGARFSKAISLSFWPPIFGKQGEAISQFETLLDQQSRLAPESDHAQTYVYLGNLYQQQGDPEKAMQIWTDGSTSFPGNSELADKLASSTSN